MVLIKGIPASDGVAIGCVALCVDMDQQVQKSIAQDPKAEIARVEAARAEAEAELNDIYLNALKRVGEENSMIFQIHIMMLQDEDYFAAICDVINDEHTNAEYAVTRAAHQFSEMFSSMDDEYMRGRAADVVDISRRLLHRLDPCLNAGISSLSGKAIVAAEDLFPSETIQMDKEKVLAFITQKGSKSSHSAILARTMNLPAVVGVGEEAFALIKNGAMAIVDGETGDILLEPDEADLKAYEAKRALFVEHQEALKALKGTQAITKSGRRMEINANIGHPSDVPMVLENDAEGIGLFRSEFLYMDTNDFPTEKQQFTAYKSVLERMEGKRVIIRTLDLGADKQVDYLHLPKEENPAMGYRAIRISLDRTDLFITQARALVRASAFGRLAIMFPMITSVEQVLEIKRLIAQVKTDLRGEGVEFDENIELGIMVETPASVVLADELAEEVDFFSIGTNDLTQYTLAVDRLNPKIASMYDPRHPAVLRMIKMTAEAAQRAGIWVGVCGESAADTALTRFYLNVGITELSVTPGAVLELRAAVQALD